VCFNIADIICLNGADFVRSELYLKRLGLASLGLRLFYKAKLLGQMMGQNEGFM